MYLFHRFSPIYLLLFDSAPRRRQFVHGVNCGSSFNTVLHEKFYILFFQSDIEEGNIVNDAFSIPVIVPPNMKYAFTGTVSRLFY